MLQALEKGMASGRKGMRESSESDAPAEGGRHAAYRTTESQSFFFPIAMPNSILKVPTQIYICLLLAVEFC